MQIESMARKGTLAELLASKHEPRNTSSTKNMKAVYKALARKDMETIGGLVAPDLEWWFRGPPHSQHMMRMLTGESRNVEFKFKPRSITTIGDRVIVEG